MKIKDGFILRKVGGQNVVVAVGAASRDFNGIIKLNETSAFLWGLLKDGASEEELLSALLAEYDISEDAARTDIGGFIAKLEGAALLVRG